MSATFEALVVKAHEAGVKAGLESRPTPMVVYEANIDGSQKKGGQEWLVDDGACGFAWIKFSGKTPFGRWMKKTGRAHKAYPTGLMVWVSEFGQSVDRKEAYAVAYAKILQEAGIEAHAGSRLD